MRAVGRQIIDGVGTVLAIGAHPDDIEIGCGGTLLRIAAENSSARFQFLVLSATPDRAREAEASAHLLLGDRVEIEVADFRDGYLPYVGAALKDRFEMVGRGIDPDVVFTTLREDRHQDHRLVSDLTWNTFRDHLILEYEIPKFDGDLGAPNSFVELDQAILDRKLDHLGKAFPSQQGKGWFSDETFRGLARLRGIECRAGSGYAEAFYGRKLRLA
jgi:LmbE family N-acetylglucosaminyl deacetylase